MAKQNKNEDAWQALFAQYPIIEEISAHGHFLITAEQIRQYREPRLMAKFDHKINLPRLFAENALSILPTSRGGYCISHFQAYHTFEAMQVGIKQMSLPAHLQSLQAALITSEAVALNCALACGIFSDFLEEAPLTPTVCGRMHSGEFSFQIQNTKHAVPITMHVDHAQIEIDAAFEGAKSLSLIEAKRDLSEDFIIRQLYYPLRTWAHRVSKPVRPIFMVYSNSIFSLYEYQFQDIHAYNSLSLVNHKKYCIESTSISRTDLETLLKNTIVLPEPDIPFPQADRFERIINLCELLLQAPMQEEEITLKYAFNARQTKYYTDAGRYLTLIHKVQQAGASYYELTPNGVQLMQLPYRQRQLSLCRLVISHAVFFEALKLGLRHGVAPARQTLIQLMKRHTLYHLQSDATYARRASTVSNWIGWILGLLNCQICL